MAGGWWYLWTDGGVGGWGLVARACWWECVRVWRCGIMGHVRFLGGAAFVCLLVRRAFLWLAC